jgi:hypothetical protein
MLGTILETPVGHIAGQLKRFVHDRTEVDAVALKFVEIDSARAASGSLWPLRWWELRKTAETLIRERLAPQDALVRMTDGFVIAYSTMKGEAARHAATDLAEELNRRLRAEASFAPPLEVSPQTIAAADLIAQERRDRLRPS